MPIVVTVDPTVPLGSESLKTGPSRIKAIAAALLQMLGFDGATAQSFVSPFTSVDGSGLVTLTGDPITPLGAATAAYADRKVIFAILSSNDGISYHGASSAGNVTAYDENALYVVFNQSLANQAGAITLSIDSGPVAPVNRSDGSSLSEAGEFSGSPGAQTFYLLMWDTANFRIVDFVGGVVPGAVWMNGAAVFGSTVTLHADPPAGSPLDAATKQYADKAVPTPTTVMLQPASVQLNGATPVAVITSGAIQLPADATYSVFIQYWLYIEDKNTHATTTRFQAWADINSNGQQFAVSSVTEGGDDGHGTVYGLQAAGFSLGSFPAGSTITVTVHASSNLADTDRQNAILSGTTAGYGIIVNGPAPSVLVTLVRSGY